MNRRRNNLVYVIQGGIDRLSIFEVEIFKNWIKWIIKYHRMGAHWVSKTKESLFSTGTFFAQCLGIVVIPISLITLNKRRNWRILFSTRHAKKWKKKKKLFLQERHYWVAVKSVLG